MALSVIGTLMFVTYLLLAPEGSFAAQTVSNIVQLFVPLVVTMPLALRAARQNDGRARIAWLLLAGAALAWGAGQVYWTLAESVWREELPYPSAADVGFLGAVPLLLTGVLFYPAHDLRAIGRTRAFLDGSIIATILLFVCFATFLDEVQPDVGGSLTSWVLAVIYPVSDVIAAAVVIAVLMRRTERLLGPLHLIGAGVVALAFADAAFAVGTTNGTYGGVELTDLGWPIGFLLIGLASLAAADDVQVAARSSRRSSHIPLLFPYVPLLPALGVFVARTATGMVISTPLALIGSAAVLLIISRQLVTSLENRQLTGDMVRALETVHQRESELEHRAFHDPLTGLANRALLRDRLEHALTGRDAPPVGLLFIDLDDFKTVNDSLGHDAGDRLLVLVAERLRASVRPGDTIARFGGDEFAILLGSVQGTGSPAILLAERVLAALENPFHIADRDLRAEASIGVVQRSLPGATAEEVLQDADLAMYAAKAGGKGRAAHFEPSLRREAVDRLELVADLRNVAANDELALHFQPIVDLSTFDVIGLEALVRWDHPRRGQLPPSDFIALAEETGSIGSIGRWAMERACAEAATWPVGSTSVAVAVNVSARQLADPTFVDLVAATLDRSGLDPRRLELEITESVLLTDDHLAARLRQLRRLGVRLAIDDFGTGYSSLSHLARLPVDVVKIDRSFVEGLGAGGDIEVLARSVVQLAADLGLRAVGEGIETVLQLSALQDMGCDAGQGDLLGRPRATPLLHLDRPASGRAVPAARAEAQVPSDGHARRLAEVARNRP